MNFIRRKKWFVKAIVISVIIVMVLGSVLPFILTAANIR